MTNYEAEAERMLRYMNLWGQLSGAQFDIVVGTLKGLCEAAEKCGRIAGLREAAEIMNQRSLKWKTIPLPLDQARGEAEAGRFEIQKRAEEVERG